MTKRAVRAVAVLIVLVGAAGLGVWTMIGRAGSSQLENWVGQCVVGVIESHLTARVQFDQLDYQAPGTVILDGLKLVGPDQSPLASVKHLRLALAEVPRLNKPIHIQSISLDSPALRFDQDANGGLLGWTTLVRQEVLAQGLEAVPSDYRLSEVLVMRRIDITDGRIDYTSAPGTDPMVLRGLTTSLDVAPDPDDPGWYAIKGAMSRPPQLNIHFDGRVNIDTMVLDLARLTTTMTLEDAQYETLPPQVQSFVRQYALHGHLSATLSGLISTADPPTSHVDFDATLRDAFASFGTSVIPIDRVRLTATMVDQAVNVDARAELLSGTAGAQATASLIDDMPISATYRAVNINLKQTLATTNPDKPLPYDGILRAQGRVRSNALTLLESLNGSGTLNIENGRLINLPVMSSLVKAVSSPFGAKKDVGSDQMLVEYRFMPDHLAIANLVMTSPVLAARGDGKVYYDQRLSLAINAGPMEKIQNHLGVIGDFFGKITDGLVKYYVSGTISEPTVSVKPLGIGAGG